ncbi:LCP family protein [Oscillochloris sp. ZM17-4]|uniref:LCP family protein n=1 Tax=Oscillochloris sp. ZM17-4 TaxID=2866714 RepID=UPI001C72F06E|nr:LCP family protein [Oscillochloris sp. ZM17-4]MBX0327674.1 LCP family protein [Oscillochloris sp. ZM17-4]
MNHAPGSPSPRTARERVAARRAARRRAPAPRQGCGPRILAAAAALSALLILALALALSWARGTLGAIEQADPRRPSAAAGQAAPTPPPALRDPLNVLLVGVDRRPDMQEGVRSDTLILVHIDPAQAWAGMLSIPRDSVAAIPHLGQQKINAAYAYGFHNAAELYGEGTAPEAAGGALAAQTVEGFLGVTVDYVAQIDFRGFQRVVDTLGGITVDVPRPLLDPAYPTDDYGYERLYIPAGLQVLDGATALRYARSRHSSSDFDRSRRQQLVLRAILAEVRARGLLSQAALLPALAGDLQQSVSTTLPLGDLDTLRGLADLAQRLEPDRIVQLSINPNDVAVSQEIGSDIYWDRGDVSALVARLLAGPEANAEVARVQVQNGAEVQGLAGRVTDALRAGGFLTVDAADALAPAAHSQLIDYGQHPQTLKRLADLLQIEPRYVFSEPPADAPPAPLRTDIVLILGADYREAWAGP